MSCCSAANEFFDDRQARHDLRRFRRRGPLPSAKKLMKALGSVDNKSILDIGSGVGAITHGALNSGAKKVTAVDASQAYLHALKQEAKRQGHSDRLTTHFGDVTALTEILNACDVATLDRVLCCYENVDALLASVANLVQWRIGVVYPRGTWFSRLGIRLFNIVQVMRRHAFRVFYHPPAHVSAILSSAHFSLVTSDKTLIWQIAVYERT